MLINRVLAFNNKVKSITELASEAIIIKGRLLFFSPRLPLRMTGRRVRTQGASTVSIPARNDGIKYDIRFADRLLDKFT